MKPAVKRFGLVIGGLCGFVSAAGFAFLLFQYIVEGSGLQVFGQRLLSLGEPVSSGTVLVGLVHVIGLAVACSLCFAAGAGLWAHGMVPDPRNGRSSLPEPRAQRKEKPRPIG